LKYVYLLAITRGGTGGGKKKTKRRSGRVTEQKEERSASPPEVPIDPDEPTYCLCDQVRNRLGFYRVEFLFGSR